jgi:hypothetical protein
MPFKTDTATVRTIGIDTGKNTLHMIGLDEKGTIVLREKVARGRCHNQTQNRSNDEAMSSFRQACGLQSPGGYLIAEFWA